MLAAANHGAMLVNRNDSYADGVFALDCGANIGAHVAEWARHMHGWGEAIAFEAQERIFYALAGNIAMNNCFNARAVWSAIGAADGTIRMPVPDHLAPSRVGAAARTVETAMCAIDGLALPRVDFVKIDIGGMAMEALAGASSTIAAHKPMLLVASNKTDLGALGRRLDEMGYRCFTFGANLIAIHASDPSSARVAAKT